MKESVGEVLCRVSTAWHSEHSPTLRGASNVFAQCVVCSIFDREVGLIQNPHATIMNPTEIDPAPLAPDPWVCPWLQTPGSAPGPRPPGSAPGPRPLGLPLAPDPWVRPWPHTRWVCSWPQTSGSAPGPRPLGLPLAPDPLVLPLAPDPWVCPWPQTPGSAPGPRLPGSAPGPRPLAPDPWVHPWLVVLDGRPSFSYCLVRMWFPELRWSGTGWERRTMPQTPSISQPHITGSHVTLVSDEF